MPRVAARLEGRAVSGAERKAGAVKRYDPVVESLLEECPEGGWVRWGDVCLLEEALRAVQYAHSRALIELPPALEGVIIELIGRHPRDGEP